MTTTKELWLVEFHIPRRGWMEAGSVYRSRESATAAIADLRTRCAVSAKTPVRLRVRLYTTTVVDECYEVPL
jgi:hypothetical protein